MRLIDADELKIDYGFTWDDITPTHEEMYALIDRQPTIEERKTGAWTSDGVRFKGGHEWMHCSECGLEALDTPLNRTNYCPNCGCFMKEGNDER